MSTDNDNDDSAKSSSVLEDIAREWLHQRAIISQAVGDFFHTRNISQQDAERFAEMLIARLAHQNLLIAPLHRVKDD